MLQCKKTNNLQKVFSFEPKNKIHDFYTTKEHNDEACKTTRLKDYDAFSGPLFGSEAVHLVHQTRSTANSYGL